MTLIQILLKALLALGIELIQSNYRADLVKNSVKRKMSGKESLIEVQHRRPMLARIQSQGKGGM